MERLIERTQVIARAAQEQRLQQIAAAMRDQGLAPLVGDDSISVRGRALVKRWLGDPLIRFAAWSRS